MAARSLILFVLIIKLSEKNNNINNGKIILIISTFFKEIQSIWPKPTFGFVTMFLSKPDLLMRISCLLTTLNRRHEDR